MMIIDEFDRTFIVSTLLFAGGDVPRRGGGDPRHYRAGSVQEDHRSTLPPAEQVRQLPPLPGIC